MCELKYEKNEAVMKSLIWAHTDKINEQYEASCNNNTKLNIENSF